MPVAKHNLGPRLVSGALPARIGTGPSVPLDPPRDSAELALEVERVNLLRDTHPELSLAAAVMAIRREMGVSA